LKVVKECLEQSIGEMFGKAFASYIGTGQELSLGLFVSK
jgi:hypothetical protein